MSERFRIKVVHKLTEEINRLSGGAFEQFGYRVMPLVQPGDWMERGTTIDGAVRRGTVDTSLGAAAYVGEMSSTAGYFEGNLAKPKEDLEHALQFHPQVKRIWLLSSRTAESGEGTNIENLISSEFLAAHPTVQEATVLDARRIAGHIFEHLGKRNLVRDLSNYLSSVVKLAEENAFSHSIPSTADLTPRVDVEANILTALDTHDYVVLQGMSGIGKTALAARVANLRKDAYDNCIWLDARDVDGIEQLQNIAMTRSGVMHNITTLLREDRILLVIDDPKFPLIQLGQIDQGQSKIIITAQVASGKQVIPITDLSAEESEAVLIKEVDKPCPPDVLSRVMAIAGGHPLVLRALNRLAAEQDWEAVVDCVETESMSELEDERNQNIFRRVLRRHSEALAFELQFVRWVGSRHILVELAETASTLLVDKLSKRGFLAATTPGYVRIHDLVFNAIQTEIFVTEANAARLRKRLATFIRSESESDRGLLQRIARVHQDLFVRLASEEGLPEFVYMAALQRTGAGTIALLGVPVAAANKLSEALIVESTLEIRAVIEVVEALFTLRVEYKSRDEARTKLETDIRALTTLLGHLGLTSEQRTMLEYHRAKMLPRLDRRDEARGKEEAISVFRALLEKDPMYATARNQLAKILPAPDSIAESEQVLRQHADKPGTVSWNVVLDSFRLLIRHGGDMAKHEGLLMSTIEYAKGIDLAEATRLVASVGQRAWFNAPHLLVPMLGALGSSEGAASSSEAFDGAQAHKYASIESEDSTARVALLKKSLRLYERASVTKEYERTHYAEALVLAGQHQKAIEVLSVVPTEKRSAFWLQRQANALNGLGSHAEALASIDLAIQTIPEPSLLAVFHRDRFRIRRAAGDEHAIEDLAIAIGLLPPGHPCRQRMEAEQQAVAASDA